MQEEIKRATQINMEKFNDLVTRREPCILVIQQTVLELHQTILDKTQYNEGLIDRPRVLPGDPLADAAAVSAAAAASAASAAAARRAEDEAAAARRRQREEEEAAAARAAAARRAEDEAAAARRAEDESRRRQKAKDDAAAAAERAAAVRQEEEDLRRRRKAEEEAAAAAAAIADEERRRRARQQLVDDFNRRAAEAKAKAAQTPPQRDPMYSDTNELRKRRLSADADIEVAERNYKYGRDHSGVTNRARSQDIAPQERLANLSHVGRIERGRQIQAQKQKQKQAQAKSGWNQIPTNEEYERGIRYNPKNKRGKELTGKLKLRGGGLDDEESCFGLQLFIPLLAEQLAWEDAHQAYYDLEPEYQQMLPKPERSPLFRLLDPIHKYIDEHSDPELLEEADGYVELMRPELVDSLYDEDNEIINRILPFYYIAMPDIDDECIPILVRAHLMRKFL
jgi:hypothetical protein